jgi:hypothetical protein
MRRALLLSALLCLILPVVLSARQSATGVTAKPWEKILGAWKQGPGPDGPTTLKIEPEGGGIKISFGCKQDGSCEGSIIGNYDGKLYKDAGNPVWEASFRKTGDRTMQEDGYFNSQLSATVAWQLSSDGKTLTRKDHSITPPGSKDIAYAYDRVGGPVSQEDPFIGFWKSDWNNSDALIETYARKGDVFVFTSREGITSERICDGKDHPNTAAAADLKVSYSCHFTDPHTEELVFKSNGKIVRTRTNKISEDGKKMVSTFINADGKATAELTYERIK